jgi:predicted outer membrane protein
VTSVEGGGKIVISQLLAVNGEKKVSGFSVQVSASEGFPKPDSRNLKTKGGKTMRIDLLNKALGAAAAIMLFGATPYLVAQDKPADNMQILREKIKADKKLLVAANMELTESEAKNFWPIYEDYQKELQNINERLGKLLQSYATDYKNKTMTDDKAKKLTDEYLSIQQAEVKLQSSYVPKLNKALPATKVARYLQIENKIRAVIKYDLAATVPLVQ